MALSSRITASGRKKATPLVGKMFKENISSLIKDSWLQLIKNLTAVVDTDHIDSTITDIQKELNAAQLGEMPEVIGQDYPGHNSFATTVNGMVTNLSSSLTTGKLSQRLKMVKSPNLGMWRFVLGGDRETVFGQENCPGGKIMSKTANPFKPILNLFRKAGIDVNLGKDVKEAFSKDIANFKFPQAVPDGNWPTSLLISAPNDSSRELLDTGIVSIKMDIDVKMDDFSMSVFPKLIIDVDTSLYKEMVVGVEDTKEAPNLFYVYTYIAHAAANSHISGRANKRHGWKGTPITDLRQVSNLLRKTSQELGVAKPRVNKAGYCISPEGLPTFVPVVDRCLEYVDDVSKNTKLDEDGNYTFQNSMMEWANTVILVDWFNDYILYTDATGKIQFYPMLGARALDTASEWIFLDQPVNSRKTVMNQVTDSLSFVSRHIEESDIKSFINKETSDYFGSSLPGVQSAWGKIVANKVDRTRFIRSAFRKDTVVSIKHLLGIDLDELDMPEQERAPIKAYANVVAAYFRAIYKKIDKLDLPVLASFSVLRYLGWAATNYADEEKLNSSKAENLKQITDMLHNAVAPAELDFPNIDTSNSGLTGVMPHQVNALMATKGVKTPRAAYPVATGGGKGVISFLEILQQMEDGFCKRPLIITKPRLVKENISEINRLSKGKINIVPIRTRNIRHLKRKAGLNTAKLFLDWAKKMPPNTIFIAAYSDFGTRATLFPDMQVPGRALWYDVNLSQMVHIVRLLGVDSVFGDESHLIKNFDSNRSRCSYSVFAGAEMQRLASGSMTPNTPIDYLGQYFALNPVLFGNKQEEFEESYGIRAGLIKNDEDARNLNARLSEGVRMFKADEEDWAYVLPVFKDTIVNFTLTPLQEEFYNILMKEALLEMQSLENKAKNKPSKSVTKTSDEDEDDEDDEDEDEDDDGRFIAKATAALATVEQFLIAPDENKEYTAWIKNPSGKDLISPAVFAMDAEAEKHFNNIPKELHAENKIMMSGWNKVASAHYFRHSKFRETMLHYTSGDEEVIRLFKTEPGLLMLAADEGSLREGENLQMCSKIFRSQPVWTPGDYKQFAARMYRPDPRGKYANREEVNHIWFIAQGANSRPTISSVKLTVMISKAISNARIQYEHDSDWRRTSVDFDNLKKLRMSLSLLFDTKISDVQPYLNKWSIFNNWVGQRVKASKLRAAENLERIHDIDLIDKVTGKIKDILMFMRLVMRPVVSTHDLPGSRREYVPWEMNAIPPDLYGLGDIAILGGQKVTIGTPVVTEFGAALVSKNASDRSITVTLASGKDVTLRRLAVGIPSTIDGKKRLLQIVSDKNAWRATYASPKVKPTAIPKVLSGKMPNKVTRVDPDYEEDDTVTLKSGETPEAEIFTALINGWPFLAIEEQETVPALYKQPGWKHITPYVAYTFASWTQASKFLDILVKKYSMRQSKFDALLSELDTLKNGRSMKLQYRVKETEVRSFFMAQHKKLAIAKDGRNVVDPYWVAIGDTVYLAFDVSAHAPEVIMWLNRAVSKVVGMKKATPSKSGYAVFPFTKIGEATTAIKMAAKVLNFDVDQLAEELEELKEDVKQFSRIKTVPR
jgi:hypothetical protein